MAAKKKDRVRHSKLDQEIIDVLREQIRKEKKTSAMLDKQVLTADKALQVLNRRVVSAEMEAEALMSAVRVLAKGLSNDEWGSRQTRTEARKILEDAKIRPPFTLGSSRKSSKRKSRKKKAS